MRALFLTHELGMRGGERQVQLLTASLRSRGWEVVLGAPKAAALGPQLAIPMANAVDPRGVLAIRKAMREVKPDIVHAFSARAHSLARLARAVPLVVTRAVVFKAGKGIGGAAKYKRGVARFIAVSNAVAAELQRAGADPALIRVVPVGVEPIAAERSRLRPDAPFAIAAVGALEPSKGFDVALHALVELPQAHLLLAGEGRERDALERLTRKLGLEDRVKFLGHVDSLGALLGAADAFVMPSRSEGMGMALIEAMSAGLPCIGARSGGIPDVVDDGVDGLLVPSESPGALADALRRLMNDGALGRKLGAKAAHSATRFSPETMALRTEAVYSEILAQRRENGS